MQSINHHLKPKPSMLDAVLLSAVAAALNDHAEVPELDQFPERRNATPQPLD
jgi:hypothetical protein